MEDWTEVEKTEFAEYLYSDVRQDVVPPSGPLRVNSASSGRSFSKKEALAFGWETMKNNLSFFVLLLIIYGMLLGIPDIIATEVFKMNVYAGAVLHIADILLSILMGICSLSIG